MADPDTAPAAWVRLCRLDELAPGRSRGFDPHGAGRDTLFVVRTAASLQGWRNACPHIDGAPMAWRKDAYLNAAADRIVCFAHGAQFDIDSGVCLSGPCLGQQLAPVPLRVDGKDAEGEVHARLDPGPRAGTAPRS